MDVLAGVGQHNSEQDPKSDSGQAEWNLKALRMSHSTFLFPSRVLLALG